MKSILKWLGIIGGILVVLVIAAMIIIPMVVDVKKYKPEIEKQVAQATGRSFSIGEDIDLSVFPWVGVKVTNVRFGNPEGFSEKQMVSVDKFEVRLKVLPLLSRKIEVKTFVLDRPQIFLEKLKNGKANWENIGSQKSTTDKKADKPEKKKQTTGPGEGLPIAELKVDNFSITNGSLAYTDQTSGMKKIISDLNLTLADISLDQPVNIDFKALLDGKPVSLKGKAGPIGKTPGKGTMTIDFALNLLDELKVKINGKLVDPAVSQQFDIQIDAAPFSAKKLVAALGMEMPLKSKDPNVLEKISFSTSVKGSPKQVSLSNGKIVLDDSTLKFMATAKEFEKPNLAFDLALDKIDIDRYLPEPPPKGQQPAEAKEKQAGASKKTDYAPLRKPVLDGKISVGELKASGATVQDILVQIKAKNGIYNIDPASLKLYSGSVNSNTVLNVQKNQPRVALKLTADKIQAGPLIKDTAKKEIIEGTMQAGLDLTLSGDTPDMIKQTLSGKGNLQFNDGAIIGIDIAQSVRNVESKLGLGETPQEKPRTDFAELKVPFTAQKGTVNLNGTSLVSPLLRILVSGDVILPKDQLDLRIDPKFVATLKGQGDTKARSGLMVPLLITGTFEKPKIRPDLKGMIGSGQNLKNLDTDALKKQILGDPNEKKPSLDIPKEDVKKQLKSLIPGFTN